MPITVFLPEDVLTTLENQIVSIQETMDSIMYPLPNITLSQTALVAISAGVRKLTVTCTGANVGDKLILIPNASMPAGYGTSDVFVSAPNTLEVNVNAPLLSIGQSYSFTMKVYRLGV